ncbi:hypothetical protein ACFL1Y_02020, partial [Patescibacteria group bacterium]
IGSALGPFLAIILSGIAYLIKVSVENHKKYRENLRRIEISTVRSIDSFVKSQIQLRKIIESIRELANNVDKIENEKEFALDVINFPLVREVYRDEEIPNFKVKSYYLHNKLLWVDAGIKEFDKINKNFQYDFKDLLRQNELLINLIKENKDPNSQAQRISYVNNLRSFANGVEKYINDTSENLIFIIQANIYNGKLRKRYGKGLYFKWKNEGIVFKYFKNKKEMKEFVKNLDSIDRIDKNINEEVDKSIKKINEKIIKINERHK